MSWDDERRTFQKRADILNSISEDEFVQVFRNWMTRLEQVIGTGGEDIQTRDFKTWFGWHRAPS
jgi:hypothetical protein